MGKNKTVSEIHVVYSKKERLWRIEKTAASSLVPYAYKEDAVAVGRAWAKKEGLELVVHNEDGKISRKDSHGRDSRRKG